MQLKFDVTNSMFCFHGSFHLAYVFTVNPQLVWFVALAQQYSLLCSRILSITWGFLSHKEKYFLKPRFFRELSNGCHSSKICNIATLPCAFKFQVKSSISAVFFCLWSVVIQYLDTINCFSTPSVFQWTVSDISPPQPHSSHKGVLPEFLSSLFTALNYLLIWAWHSPYKCGFS